MAPLKGSFGSTGQINPELNISADFAQPGAK